MISKKSTFFLGIFLFFIPFMGFPSSWKNTLVIISGLILIALSVKVVVPKRTSRTRLKKEKITPVFMENSPISLKDNTVEKSQEALGNVRSDIK